MKTADFVACTEIEKFWVIMFRVIVQSSVIGRRVITMNALHGIRMTLT